MPNAPSLNTSARRLAIQAVLDSSRDAIAPAPMATIQHDYRSILRLELKLRQRFNRRYSLRAFARHLGLSPHRLSSVLNGRFGLSPGAAEELALRLELTAEQSSYFRDLVESEHARSAGKREAAFERVRATRGTELWPKRPPAVEMRLAHELALWGLADPDVLTRLLAARGMTLYLSAEFGGAACVSLMARKSFDDGPAPHHEFSVIVLVADIHSTTGYGIYVFNHLTDSLPILRSRERHFEKAPRLCGRIQVAFPGKTAEAVIENDAGACILEYRTPDVGKLRSETKMRFSLVRNVRLASGKIGKTRVLGLSRYRDRKFDPERDSFWVRPGTKLDAFLRKVYFRPVSWRFYRSEYDYFPLTRPANP